MFKPAAAAPDRLEEPLSKQANEMPVPDSLNNGFWIFECWADDERVKKRLTPASIEKYIPLWNAWIGWLSALELQWDRVTPTQIHAFLNGPPPGQHTRRKAIHKDRMSAFTKHRYYRVLLSVYQTAVKRELVPANPCLDLEMQQRPALRRQDLQPQRLEPRLFDALKDPHRLRLIIRGSEEGHHFPWWYERDKALISVLVSTGITVSELIAMKGCDLVRGDGSQVDPRQLIIEGAAPSLRIAVMGEGDSVSRTLDVLSQLAPLVLEWVGLRHRMLIERASRSLSLTQRSAYMREHAERGPLFFARRAKDDLGDFRPLRADGIYYIVKQCLSRLREDMESKSELVKLGGHIAYGPGIVRNTVIADWARTLDPADVVERAGFKDSHSLRV